MTLIIYRPQPTRWHGNQIIYSIESLVVTHLMWPHFLWLYGPGLSSKATRRTRFTRRALSTFQLFCATPFATLKLSIITSTSSPAHNKSLLIKQHAFNQTYGRFYNAIVLYGIYQKFSVHFVHREGNCGLCLWRSVEIVTI